ncbi:MAG: hypothetical protein RIE77_13895 [Phycisphaerales bacterium]|jgi:hypothetical protein
MSSVSMREMNREFYVRYLICLLLGIGAVVAPAHAQWGMGMGNDAMQMAIGRASVDRYSDLLGFDEVQRETAEMLHRDYLDSFKQANDTLMDAMQRLQEEAGKSGDWQKMMKPMGRIMLGFFDRLEALEATFFDDLKMIAIEPGQQEAFVRVERARRREQVETAGQISVVNGGTIDLHEIAREVEVSGNEAAREALLAYEAEIDPVYKRLIDRSFGFMRDQMERMKDMDDDDESMGFDAEAMEKMQDAMKDMRELGSQGKSINARYARQIMQLLPTERQAAWDTEVKRRTWPTVYRQSKAERQIEAAGKLDSLTAQQREGLDAIRQTYEREAAPINDRWAKAIDEQQTGDEMNWWGWGQDSEEADAAEEARKELDDRFVERVRGLLTAEQLESMPSVGESGFDADEVLREFGGG